jgi:signal transduction histidine kinase
MVRTSIARRPPVENRKARGREDQASAVATAEDPLARLQGQLEALKTQVRQAQQLAALGSVAPMIAHEVSNFLTPILAYAQVALRSQDAALMAKALTVTLRNCEIVIAMSDRLLGISAAKAAKREAIILREVVDEAHASLCRDFSKDGIQFKVEVDPELAVVADALQLQQVFFNLFMNAREAMAPRHSGLLAVTASREDAGADADRSHIVVEVRNTGDPIPSDLLPYIFDAFRTSKTSERNGRQRCGGIGLTLCRDLVEENGGTISVTSDDATGTIFRISLPTG